ncbi:hypothetical protein Tco_0339407 [Tanacetum coccineum]
MIYGEESGIKIRGREESHYSESKTPTARTEPRRRHGECFYEAIIRSPVGLNRLGRKEPVFIPRVMIDSSARSPQAQKELKLKQECVNKCNTTSRFVLTSQYSESEDSEGRSLESNAATFSLPRSRMPSHVKNHTTEAVIRKESPNVISFGRKQKLPKESIDSYEDLRQRLERTIFSKTKHSKDPVGHYITTSKETENLRRTRDSASLVALGRELLE